MNMSRGASKNRRFGVRRLAVLAAIVMSASTVVITDGVATTGASPLPPSVPIGMFQVDAHSATGTDTTLVGGQPYLFTVSGQYFAGANTSADAECSATSTDARYQRDRYVAATGADMFGLQVDRQDVSWTPITADAAPGDPGCDSHDHRYTFAYTPAATQAINFRVLDTYYGDNFGMLMVTVSVVNGPPSPGTLLDSFDVSATNPAGETSSVTMRANNIYRVRASGVFSTSPGVTSDAACQQTAVGGVRPSPVNGGPAPVVVNHGTTNWSSTQNPSAGCNDVDHTYTFDLPAGSTGKINVAVNDSWHVDNAGSIHVEIFLNPPGTATASPGGLTIDTVQVDTANPDGGTTTMRLIAGQSYLFTVTGTYTPGSSTTADAECSATPGDPHFVHDRYTLTTGVDSFGLQVAHHDVSWTPTEADALPGDPACNSVRHRYSLAYTPADTATVNFRALDTFYGDNVGTLIVTVSLANNPPTSGTLLDDFYVDANNPYGVTSTVTMTGDHTYRVRASGVFATSATATADPACQQTGGHGVRPNAVNHAPTPVLVNHAATDWSSTKGAAAACNDTDHSYVDDLPAGSTGSINVAVNDTWFNDNGGSIHVQVFADPPASAPVSSP